MNNNPIFKGFNPDPSICRRNNDYYVAVSSFEWFPSMPIYHSTDLKNWTLHTHVLRDEKKVDLTRLPSAKGIWAPCLTWCEEEQLFYVIYGVMNSMHGRYFDVDNYLITAPEITGPWSEPVYLHSGGYDASILHDEDGRKWIVAVDWETRDGHNGAISLVEYSPETSSVIGYPKRIWSGMTGIGAEGPHLTKRGHYYYLMCAEGGTGYGHCVTMARAEQVWGPYESDAGNPILTSVNPALFEKNNAEYEKPDFSILGVKDYLRPECFNPEVKIQKAGHGSYVETPEGEVYLVHLCARPFRPELCCPLGRESGIQKMRWTADGWMRLEGDDNIAKEVVEPSALPESPSFAPPVRDHFDDDTLALHYYAPRINPDSFTDLHRRASHVCLRGQESLSSTNKVSLLARKLTAVYTTVKTKMHFTPEVFQHSAGLVLYYDNMNYLYLQKHYDEENQCAALSVIHMENGAKREDWQGSTRLNADAVYLRMTIEGRAISFAWSYDDVHYQAVGKVYETIKFSDEYSQHGEFTGTFVGIACVDSVLHRHAAAFDFFDYQADETRDVE
ncbi:glycoside hydrolase family 43 protein [Pectobacterium carotovorum]|nr:glycoside hydrolase family 43 protein [Pectobacterium carotovorum]ULS46877.1 glycoside hydrolase family 43 protein [Pectobacterium carotovorum]